MSAAGDLDDRLAWITSANVLLFGAALVIGIVLHLASPGSAMSAWLLQAGLVLLMSAPAVRILIAVIERVRRGDWIFVLMTTLVVIELAIVLWRAAGKAE